MLSSTNARLATARRLTSRKDRRETGRFLAEGAQAVREALLAGAVVEVFATAEAMARNADLLAGVSVSEISPKDAASLSETVTPQGLVAVCTRPGSTADDVLARAPRLIVVLVEPNDPGNLGTIIRTADAAGADAVVVAGGVDPYNGKAVRASAGSLFHLPVLDGAVSDLLVGARAAGMATLAAAVDGTRSLDELIDDGSLRGDIVWLFGNEARGLPDSVRSAADETVRIPIYGSAESLNLAAAAAVCLYASARAQRPAAELDS
ncbi:MAG: RNA methyltransferase [Pseudonocardiales bacterium]|nr:MAG: RNA methyltransferase [Pseudonocardiales bacterium]